MAGAQAIFALATDQIPSYRDPQTGSIPGVYRAPTFFVTVYGDDGYSLQPPAGQPLVFTLRGGFTTNDKLYLFNTLTQSWISATETCGQNASSVVVNGTLTVNVCHLTQFATFTVEEGGAVPDVKPSGSASADKTAILVVAIVLPIGVAILVAVLVLALWRNRRNKKAKLFDEEDAVNMEDLKAPEESIRPQVIIAAPKPELAENESSNSSSSSYTSSSDSSSSSSSSETGTTSESEDSEAEPRLERKKLQEESDKE
jgi:hypothetical protein